MEHRFNLQVSSLPDQSLQLQNNRCCILNTSDGNADDCCSLVMAAEKSESFAMPAPCKSPPSKKFRKERNQGKLLRSKASMEVLDQEIWREFPEDLFEAVIARLPIATFFRFRLVCRKWNSLLSSEFFFRHCAQLPQANPWFYMSTHENLNFMYDPSSKKWHRPTISSLHSERTVFPVASAGGLVCLLDIGHGNLYVCNPLTQSFRELPARPGMVRYHRIVVGMTLNGNAIGGGYKVLWLRPDGDYEVYDSLKNSWTRPGSLPANIERPLTLRCGSKTVSIESTLYFMCAIPGGIVSYNMVTGVWEHFIIPVPLHLCHATLAEFRGQLILVGLLTENEARCVCIWELQKMTLLWKEVDRMPKIWCLEFYGKHISMTCLGNKGLLMLSLTSTQMERLVIYNMMNREWVKVTRHLGRRGRMGKWIKYGTAFHPCLFATA